MVDPVSLLTVVVCFATCFRIVAFRRGSASYKLFPSLLAWVLAAGHGGQALAELMGLYRIGSPFVLVILLVVCALVFRARGNVASIIRLDWSPAWDGSERRRVH